MKALLYSTICALLLAGCGGNVCDMAPDDPAIHCETVAHMGEPLSSGTITFAPTGAVTNLTSFPNASTPASQEINDWNTAGTSSTGVSGVFTNQSANLRVYFHALSSPPSAAALYWCGRIKRINSIFFDFDLQTHDFSESPSYAWAGAAVPNPNPMRATTPGTTTVPAHTRTTDSVSALPAAYTIADLGCGQAGGGNGHEMNVLLGNTYVQSYLAVYDVEAFSYVDFTP